jgi:hypothetical protein
MLDSSILKGVLTVGESISSSSLTKSSNLTDSNDLASYLSFFPWTFWSFSQSLKMSRLANIVSSLYFKLCSTRSRILLFRLSLLSSNLYLNVTTFSGPVYLRLKHDFSFSCGATNESFKMGSGVMSRTGFEIGCDSRVFW